MQKWQTTLFMVLGGIVPAVVAIVVLQQFGIIGLDTSLLLGLLYLLFISTNVWCRIFTKVPPQTQHEQQVDSLPCYEEAVKAEPPPYHVLYPGDPPSYDVTTSCTITSTVAASPTSDKSKPTLTFATPSHVIPFKSTSATFSPSPDNTQDSLPILGRLEEGNPNRTSKPIVVPSQVSNVRHPTRGSSDCPPSSCEAPSVSPEGGEERRTKKDRIYSRMLESIGNPLDYV